MGYIREIYGYICIYIYIEIHRDDCGGRLELHGVRVGVRGLGHGVSGFQV